MKKVLLLAISLPLSLVLLVIGTYSWFFAVDQEPNDFAIGHYGVELNEVFDGWRQKEVWVSNVGDIRALVRMAAVPLIYVKDEDGEIVQRLDTVVDGRPIVKLIYGPQTNDWAVGDSWIDGEDGWYYYTSALEPGKETELFLQKVEFDVPSDFFTEHPEYLSSWWAAQGHSGYYVQLDVDALMGSSPVQRWESGVAADPYAYKHEETWPDVQSLVKAKLRAIVNAFYP